MRVDVDSATIRKFELVTPPTGLTVKQEDQLGYALDYADRLGIKVNLHILE
jgi:hypothetical protein